MEPAQGRLPRSQVMAKPVLVDWKVIPWRKHRVDGGEKVVTGRVYGKQGFTDGDPITTSVVIGLY